MSDEIELIPDEDDTESYFLSYLEKIELPEIRRYIALDMARMSGALPDKLVKLSEDIERFLLGTKPKLVRTNDN